VHEETDTEVERQPYRCVEGDENKGRRLRELTHKLRLVSNDTTPSCGAKHPSAPKNPERAKHPTLLTGGTG
jgi:hypothetical protein